MGLTMRCGGELKITALDGLSALRPICPGFEVFELFSLKEIPRETRSFAAGQSVSASASDAVVRAATCLSRPPIDPSIHPSVRPLHFAE